MIFSASGASKLERAGFYFAVLNCVTASKWHLTVATLRSQLTNYWQLYLSQEISPRSLYCPILQLARQKKPHKKATQLGALLVATPE